MPALPGFDEEEEEEEEILENEEHDIIARLEGLGTGCLYEDTSFPASRGSLYRSSGAVPDYDANVGAIKWMRPHEFSRDPDYFKGGEGAGGIRRGTLDDAWLIGAMALVAAHSGPLVENLFCSDPDDFKHFGVFTCCFYKNGEWQEIIADTRIPCMGMPGDGGGVPVYGHTLHTDEIWVELLEKAYAKLHGSYEALSGGNIGEALVDLTGGCCERIYLQSDAASAAIEDGSLWEKLNRYISWEYLLACECVDPDRRAGVSDEEGLLANSAYSIVGLTEQCGLRLVRVRNPWQTGDWLGDWSESSQQWEDFPEVYTAVSSDSISPWRRDMQDGTFWMSFEDFTKKFTVIYNCRLFQGEGFRQYCVHGEWSGKAAGGAPTTARRPSLSKDQQEGQEKLKENLRRTSLVHIQKDNDPYWFNNPQYRLTVESPTDVLISLLQQDRRSVGHTRDYFSTAFEVIKMKRHSTHSRVWEYKDSEEVASSTTSLASLSRSSSKGCREIIRGGIRLDPRFAYNVVPHALEQGREGKFTLRIFSQSDVTVEPVGDTHTVYLQGMWDRAGGGDTAGGPLRVVTENKGIKTNPKWCQNPQYWLKIPSCSSQATVDVKLVLRRAVDMPGGTRASTSNKTKRRSSITHNALMGIVACKAIAPEAAGQGQQDHRQRRAAKRTNALGEPLPVKESSLKRPARPWYENARQEDQHNAEPLADRRIHISDNEWCQMSDYTSPDAATMTLLGLKHDWMPHGLSIVPSLSEKGVKGKYVLEVHSDHALEIGELSDSVSKTIAAGWAEGAAGGSHLHPDWKRNPAFHIRFKSPGRAAVKITLSRPEHEWSSTCRKNSVGAMMGFYLIRGGQIARSRGAITHEGMPWDESPFVPSHSVSTPQGFELESSGPDDFYTVLPATYEPGQHGPFFLSVVTSADFSLSRVAGSSSSKSPKSPKGQGSSSRHSKESPSPVITS